MFVMRGLWACPTSEGSSAVLPGGPGNWLGSRRGVWNWVPEVRPKQSEGPSLDRGACEGCRGPCATVRRGARPSSLHPPCRFGLRDYVPQGHAHLCGSLGDTVQVPGLYGLQATRHPACRFPLIPRSLPDEPVLVLLLGAGDLTDRWA